LNHNWTISFGGCTQLPVLRPHAKNNQLKDYIRIQA
jgi:hypothetical protein